MKSQLLSSQIFASNWIEQSAAFHSSMRIFVQRSLRPIVPYAGRLIVIGLPTFVSVSGTQDTYFNNMILFFS